MGKQLKDLTFEGWLAYVFDHPVEDHKEAWYWDIDRDWWEEDPANVIEFLTQAFENAEAVFQPYSDAQLNQGLWYIADNSCSNHMFAILDENILLPARLRCIYSMHKLYEQCFSKRCTPHFSHFVDPGVGPLNVVCYMWWDIIPFSRRPNDPARKELDQAVLEVMESTLQLDSIACRESALHGLGHWQHDYPDRVGEIIDKFSMTHRDLHPKLEAYMINAYTGYVL